MRTLETVAGQLQNGECTSVELTEACIAKSEDPSGQGSAVFIHIDAENALAQAQKIDAMRAEGQSLHPLAGVPVTVKDLFDIEGQVTRAGSVVLGDAEPAMRDAAIVSRLRKAGMVIIGRTNMTEFAYSGLGLNPHYGTPLNPFDRLTGRIPGGSSSGAAISITDEMAYGAIGTDTGGSCRIPAALCGLTGFKPTASRVPMKGTLPLSQSFDSIGPIAATVTGCIMLDAVLSDKLPDIPKPKSPGTLRFAVLRNYVVDDVDETVSQVFEHALGKLDRAGVELVDLVLPMLDELPSINAKGGLVAAEAYAWHHDLLQSSSNDYDPRVSSRIIKGADQSARDYIQVLAARRNMIDEIAALTSEYNGILCPTVPRTAPAISSLIDETSYAETNLLMLRNPTVANFLDRCAISIPVTQSGVAPVGIMLMGKTMGDEELLAAALSVENVLGN